MHKALGIFLATSLLLFAAAGESYCQKYEPRDSWPYIYEDFQEGAVRAVNGELISEGIFNVEIVRGKLHYVVGSTIIEADISRIYTAKIGSMVYVNRAGRMLKVLAESEYGAVLQDVRVDMDELNKTDIGYGISSSTASHQQTNLTQLGLDNISGINLLKENAYEDLVLRKGSGKVLPTLTTNYLFVKGLQIRADRRNFLDVPGIDKKEAARFLKENKIKWNDIASLAKAIEYLYKNLN